MQNAEVKKIADMHRPIADNIKMIGQIKNCNSIFVLRYFLVLLFVCMQKLIMNNEKTQCCVLCLKWLLLFSFSDLVFPSFLVLVSCIPS